MPGFPRGVRNKRPSSPRGWTRPSARLGCWELEAERQGRDTGTRVPASRARRGLSGDPGHPCPGLTAAPPPAWSLNCAGPRKRGGARSRPGFRAGFAEVRSSVHDPLGSGKSRASANGRGGRGGDWPGDLRGPRVASPPSRSLGPVAPPARRPLKPGSAPRARPKPTGPEPAPPVCGPEASAPQLRSRRWVQSPARRCGPGLSFAGVVGKRLQQSLAQFVLGGRFALLELLLLKRLSTPCRRCSG